MQHRLPRIWHRSNRSCKRSFLGPANPTEDLNSAQKWEEWKFLQFWSCYLTLFHHSAHLLWWENSHIFIIFYFSLCLNNSTLDTMMVLLPFCLSQAGTSSDRIKLPAFSACSPCLPYYFPHSCLYYPRVDNPGYRLTSPQVPALNPTPAPAVWQCPTKKRTHTSQEVPTRACNLGHSTGGPQPRCLDPSRHMCITLPCVLTWDGSSLTISEHHNQQRLWPFCFLSQLFRWSHTLIYTWSVLGFCFLLLPHLITCCTADYQKPLCSISESICQPQSQHSSQRGHECAPVQVLAHPACCVTILNNNITNTLNNTVISMVKIMSTVNCLDPCFLCSPCREV